MEQQNYYNTALGAAGGIASRQLFYKCVKKGLAGINKSYIAHRIHHKTEFREPLIEVLKKSGLAKDGIEIFNINSENSDTVNRIVNSRCKRQPKKSILPVYVKKILYRLRTKQDNAKTLQILEGYNACVIPDCSAILINMDKLSIAGFHELGHQYKSSNLWRRMLVKSKMPLVKYVPPLLLMVGLLKNKKTKSEAPKNTFDKMTDFIKNNCGKLTSLCFVPLLTEEAIASINAAKLSKGILNKPMLKSMCKYNAFAFSTYVSGALLAGCASFVGVKVRDKIVEKNIIKA